MALLEGDKYVLISSDLMRHLNEYVEPPAQLCLIRVIGSDHEYVFRVRYGDVYLDHPFSTPLLDSASKVEGACDWDEVRKFCAVASAMVVPPGVRDVSPQYYPKQPQVLSPMTREMFPYWG